MKKNEDYEEQSSNILYNKKGVIDMRLTVELTGISKGDIELFQNMNNDRLTVRIQTSNDYAKITARGSYDELIPVIMQATSYRSYSIQLN